MLFRSIPAFENGLRKIVEHMINTYPEKKILLANYHTFRKGGNLSELHVRNEIYFERGNIIRKIAAEYGFPFVDLFSVMKDRNDISDLYADDGVHLREKGYKLLADKVCEYLLNC